MKPHVSGEGSLANEFRRSIGDKLHQVDEATMAAASAAISADGSKQGRILKYNQAERRRRWSHRVEDPIRTLMFLGSLNHT
ncbi:uncharacterized protein LOC113872083 [Abrus precatorius]|uniref:Uncharacterized protein LOC113872083 n=1 Tax=Abrus precatorius TaxID=3816 RepID=A0A8B8M9C0_ABRPR|nr:uncharacterized protein LOC113872083 [Abrus precatorius]